MPLPCVPRRKEQLTHLEMMHQRLPSLNEIFTAWSCDDVEAYSDALILREQLLGMATISRASLRLLFTIATRFVDDLPARIYWHEATQSAAETQAILPTGVFVQKTVSVDMAGKLLLWTSVGEQLQDLQQRKAVAALLGLPRSAAKRCSINPSSCHCEVEFAMSPGMVSPFLPPFHSNRLTALVQTLWPDEWDKQGKEVAVSLSLFESLLLPLNCFYTILRHYHAQAYSPVVPWIELPFRDRLVDGYEQVA